MERQASEDQGRRSSTMGPAIPIATVTTSNENWRGKNDPAERRRIQNRLNQRAFRQRQRSGESPKQYKSRSTSQHQESEEDEESSESSSSESSAPSPDSEGRVSSEPTEGRSSSTVATEAGHVWDELGQLINRNFMAAAVTNAQHIGINLVALRAGTPSKTPRATNRQISATLTPVELQYQVSHDPIIDVIPHARLRFNILRAIATRQIEAAEFSKCLRASGGLELLNGSWQRSGVVVWSAPEQVGSWELSESFVRRWIVVLQGCEDLIAATNCWRNRRGERLFPTTLNRS
ncbi:hypothetical protein LTR37_003793 [Vermiconidia calcicola]|uniref:Uncharacterized protein n=1 Tax=Vermiconidia calcicola TaxID=1690605 RepID=A0ACC3NP67_9PEZI|nr:hypothetical protein LTR37_003793 [Vermiconidia calcicola]